MYEPESEHEFKATNAESRDLYRHYLWYTGYITWCEKDEEQVQQEASKATKIRSKAKLPNTKLHKQVLQRASKEAQGIQRNRRKQR